MKKVILSLAVLFTLSTAFVSCRDTKETKVEVEADDVADDVEDAMDDAGDAIEDAANDTGDAIEDAADDVEDATTGEDDN
ncbi:hypothetical protein [Marinirhabdus gelatinilytica]|uniref:Uncharacterized protein n=1 Tax=Marinirhabdus gelatinilytica TaxID=1703343 RepID=A0A370Q677_9FLAO|nr:hypothetical protein [Marinirhabdus gelatinilytica]RDK83865.1 hypothetical protein C8D94_10678 [Marinirhabdus gelatinilytica]